MAVKIRLKRLGNKNRPFYRIVVVPDKSTRDGRTLEQVGYYDPLKTPSYVSVDEARVKYWLSVGAQPTDTVRRFLSNVGIVLKKKRTKKNESVASTIKETDSDTKKVVPVAKKPLKKEKETVAEKETVTEEASE